MKKYCKAIVLGAAPMLLLGVLGADDSTPDSAKPAAPLPDCAATQVSTHPALTQAPPLARRGPGGGGGARR